MVFFIWVCHAAREAMPTHREVAIHIENNAESDQMVALGKFLTVGLID